MISDRLIEISDNEWFMGHTTKLMKEHFSLNMADVIGHLDPEEKNQAGLDSLRRLFFWKLYHC